MALARADWGMGPALCWAGMCEQHPDHSPGPCPALPSSALTTERRGNRKTELTLGNTASALSPNLQDFVIQGFLLVKQAGFGYIRQEPVQRALHPAYYFPSCEPWLQASSEASQETSPNSSTPQSVPGSHSLPLPMTLQTQPLGSWGSGCTACQHRMPYSP